MVPRCRQLISIATLFSIISLNRTRFPVKDDGTFSRMSPEPCAAWEGARSVISSSARVARCFLPFSYHSVYFCFLSSSQSGFVWLWSRLLSPTKDSHDNPWIEVHEEGTAWHRNTTRCDSVQRCEQKNLHRPPLQHSRNHSLQPKFGKRTSLSIFDGQPFGVYPLFWHELDDVQRRLRI